MKLTSAYQDDKALNAYEYLGQRVSVLWRDTASGDMHLTRLNLRDGFPMPNGMTKSDVLRRKQAAWLLKAAIYTEAIDRGTPQFVVDYLPEDGKNETEVVCAWDDKGLVICADQYQPLAAN